MDNDPPLQTFLWEDGAMHDLGPDFPERNSKGLDINNSSQITGYMWSLGETEKTAFIWDSGDVVSLGSIPEGFTSQGYALNNHGDVTGRGEVPADNPQGWVFHGFMYSDGVMIDIGTVPGPEEYRARDINDAQQIVGYCEEDPNNPRNWAFLWSDGIMYFLEDLVVSGPDFEASHAYAINNAGQITARGVVDGEYVAVLLTPVNARPADINWDGRVDIDDLFEVLGEWGECPDPPQVCEADVNDDGAVNLQDILAVVSDWG